MCVARHKHGNKRALLIAIHLSKFSLLVFRRFCHLRGIKKYSWNQWVYLQVIFIIPVCKPLKHEWPWLSRQTGLNMKCWTILECTNFLGLFGRILKFSLVGTRKYQQAHLFDRKTYFIRYSDRYWVSIWIGSKLLLVWSNAGVSETELALDASRNTSE